MKLSVALEYVGFLVVGGGFVNGEDKVSDSLRRDNNC